MARSNSSATSQLRILVLGYLIRGPLGGLAWHYLQYVIGLSRLGHQVYFVEDSDNFESCYDPSHDMMVADPSYGIAFARQAFDRIGLSNCWAYYDAHTTQWLGPATADIRSVIADAELLINVSGVTQLRNGLDQVAKRALIDTDPAFTQICNLTDPAADELSRSHNCFFSFGENVGQSSCSIPDDGIPWQPTRQPIVLDAWPVTPPPVDGPFSTVMQWQSYPARQYEGRRFGLKADSFEPLMDLPQEVEYCFELAVGSPSAPKDRLRKNGWQVINPLEPTKDPWTYQDFIARSRGEFGVAKHGYVVTNSGWFSERTAAYLASGRPAIVQETGFHLPVGEGLLGFTDRETACEALAEVAGDVPRHGRAAREIAVAHFDSADVLSRLIDRCFTT